MAKTRKNNRQLKSMEEFKCTNKVLKLFLTVLIVIPLSHLFLSRMNTFGEFQSENICIDLTSHFDTNQQKDTETTEIAETSIPKANNVVETENQVKTEESDKAEKSVQTTESIETIQDIESADYVEESVDIDSASEKTSLEEQIVYEDFIVPVTEYEIDLMVQAVQHEVGASEWFFPDADIDYIQQCMARVIVNKVGTPLCGDTIYSTLILSGHFMTEEDLEGIDPKEERTRKNVLTVLRGEDSISHKITIEMSFSSSCTFEDSIIVMERQVGPVIPYFWTVSAEDRLLIFAEPDESANSE